MHLDLNAYSNCKMIYKALWMLISAAVWHIFHKFLSYTTPNLSKEYEDPNNYQSFMFTVIGINSIQYDIYFSLLSYFNL